MQNKKTREEVREGREKGKGKTNGRGGRKGRKGRGGGRGYRDEGHHDHDGENLHVQYFCLQAQVEHDQLHEATEGGGEVEGEGGVRDMWVAGPD